MRNHWLIPFWGVIVILFAFPYQVFSQVQKVTVYPNAVVAETNSGEYKFQHTDLAAGQPDGKFMTTSSSGIFGMQYSNIVVLRKFNFNLPPHAVVTSIQVNITRRTSESHLLFGVYDHLVQFSLNGTRIGPNKAKSSKWSTQLSSVEYKWESEELADIHPAMMNNEEFGIALQIKSSGINLAHSNYVDGISLTVQYITSVLPAALKFFDVRAVNGISEISWEVLSDFPGEELIVEYSVDGKDWVPVCTKILSASNTKGNYLHNVKDNIRHYRLKLSFKNEIPWISKIKTLTVSEKTAEKPPFPNPVQNVLYFRSKEGKVVLLGLDGRRYAPSVYLKGDYFAMDLSGFPPGIYMLKTEDDTYKILKQ